MSDRRRSRFPAATRRKIEAAVEAMIDLLDAIDGDPDLEPEIDGAVDDEPCDDLYGEALARARAAA